jgi:hypothetical protein
LQFVAKTKSLMAKVCWQGEESLTCSGGRASPLELGPFTPRVESDGAVVR